MVHLFTILFSIHLYAHGRPCPQIKDGTHFAMTQVYFTVGNDFVIETGGGLPMGRIVERVLRWNRTFDLYNEKGEFVARAQDRYMSWGSKIDVYDCNGKWVGGFQEQIFKSAFKTLTSYSIVGDGGNQIGRSQKLDWFGTTFTLYDNQNVEIASLSRPYFNPFKDHWDVAITPNEGVVDLRVLFFAGAYKTAVDRKRASEESSN